MSNNSPTLEELLAQVAERQSTRQDRLLAQLESNPDILMPLLKDLKVLDEQSGDRQSTTRSDSPWRDLLREKLPQLTDAEIEEITEVT